MTPRPQKRKAGLNLKIVGHAGFPRDLVVMWGADGSAVCGDIATGKVTVFSAAECARLNAKEGRR